MYGIAAFIIGIAIGAASMAIDIGSIASVLGAGTENKVHISESMTRNLVDCFNIILYSPEIVSDLI